MRSDYRKARRARPQPADEPALLSLFRAKHRLHLANRRRVPPRGLNGGADGAPGRNWVERADGAIEMLTATDWADVDVGDHFIIQTPGGGGFGREGE